MRSPPSLALVEWRECGLRILRMDAYGSGLVAISKKLFFCCFLGKRKMLEGRRILFRFHSRNAPDSAFIFFAMEFMLSLLHSVYCLSCSLGGIVMFMRSTGDPFISLCLWSQYHLPTSSLPSDRNITTFLSHFGRSRVSRFNLTDGGVGSRTKTAFNVTRRTVFFPTISCRSINNTSDHKNFVRSFDTAHRRSCSS